MSVSKVLRHAGATACTCAVVELLVMAGGAAMALAATHTVCPSGCEYTEIQPAIDAASSGDTIKIAAGTYKGNLTVNKNLTLEGAGARQTTINGGSPVVTINSGVSATISGVTVTGGTNGSDGGGIDNSGTLMLSNSTVTGNSAEFGGGLYNEIRATAALNNSKVGANTAAKYGGGVYNDANELGTGTVTLTNSAVSGNTVSGKPPENLAGGIYNAGSLTLTKSTVSSNHARHVGGIDNVSPGLEIGGTLTLTSSTVSENSAETTAGGIENNEGTVTLTSSTVSRDTAGGSGGGILTFLGTVTLNKSTVSGNTVHEPEGCAMFPVFCGTAGAGIANGSFEEGGTQPTLTLNNSTVSDNTGAEDGGGIWGPATLNFSLVTGNSAEKRSTGKHPGGLGGGLFVPAGKGERITLNNTSVTSNKAAANGGGAYVSLESTLTLTQATIASNTASEKGGGIFNQGEVTGSQSAVAHNHAEEGAGIFDEGGTVNLKESFVQP